MIFARITLLSTLLVAALTTGCAHSTTAIRQEDGTVRKFNRLILRPSASDYRKFTCKDDYMVSCVLQGVTYEWPKGKGELSKDYKEIHFKGDKIECQVTQRRLTVDGVSFGEFSKGDRVRITSDGRVFVNDNERKPVDQT